MSKKVDRLLANTSKKSKELAGKEYDRLSDDEKREFETKFGQEVREAIKDVDDLLSKKG